MDGNHSLRAFVVLCRTFHSVSEEAKKDIKTHGLSLTEFETLELLYHQGEQPIQAIAEKVLLTSGSMTYVVNQLEKKKFVKRIACNEDRRIILAKLTAKGRKLLDTIFPEHERFIENIFSPLSEKEIKSFIQTLKKISRYS